MDHQAFAQLLGNYGEFVGAVAVVGTLVYLAIQVRLSRQATLENTKAVRSEIFESLNQTETAFAGFFAEHATELAEVQSFTSRDQLTPEQNILAGALGSLVFRATETAYLHHKNGVLDDDLLDARMRGFGAFIDRFPMLRDNIKIYSSGAGGYSDEFIRDLLEAIPTLRRDDS
jgi:hypothetical protein